MTETSAIIPNVASEHKLKTLTLHSMNTNKLERQIAKILERLS